MSEKSRAPGRSGDSQRDRRILSLAEARNRRIRQRVHRRRERPAPLAVRPTTVWPCGGDRRSDGSGLLAEWLLRAVVKIVTLYTAPGARVLILEPPVAPAGATSRGKTGCESLAGLAEAAWTVARLGRSVQT